MLREEAAFTEEVEEREISEVGDDQEKRKLNNAAVSSESPSFEDSQELEKLPPMAVLKPPHDIQYLEQVLHCHRCVLGVTVAANMDVFLENFQTALTPPPLSFFGNYIALFSRKSVKYA